MALLEEAGTERREVDTDRGAARVFTVAPLVSVVIVVGHMELPVAELILASARHNVERSEGKKLYAFMDWLDLTGYDAACRRTLTGWTLENRDAFAEMHLAQRSKLVGMGVEVANLALGGLLHSHSSRATLEAELRRVIRELDAAR